MLFHRSFAWLQTWDSSFVSSAWNLSSPLPEAYSDILKVGATGIFLIQKLDPTKSLKFKDANELQSLTQEI